MQKAESSGYGLDYVVLNEEIYASPVPRRVLQRVRYLLVKLLPRRLQHGFFMGLLPIVGLLIGYIDKCKRTEYGTARSCARP